jgi:hypothetical protein
MWKEVVVAWFEVLPWYLRGVTKEDQVKLQLKQPVLGPAKYGLVRQLEAS